MLENVTLMQLVLSSAVIHVTFVLQYSLCIVYCKKIKNKKKLDLMQNICRILQLTDISIMAFERDKSRTE